MASRFQREGGPRVQGVPLTAPDLGELDPEEVLITFHENENPAMETSRWIGDSMILPRIPLRYDDWGFGRDGSRHCWSAWPLIFSSPQANTNFCSVPGHRADSGSMANWC